MRHACVLYLKDVMGMQVDTLLTLSQLDRKTGKVIVVKRHHHLVTSLGEMLPS